MGKQQAQYQLSHEENDLVSPDIFSHFHIKNHHYIVICERSEYEAFTGRNSSYPPESLTDSVVGQLRLDNQLCIIIEVESDAMENNDSNITTLLTEREL